MSDPRAPRKPAAQSDRRGLGDGGAGLQDADIGFVVIARNGGSRLGESLTSVLGFGVPVVYADSASTDGSLDLARRLGAEVMSTDSKGVQTAGRGRNAGFDRLRQLMPDVMCVQFVDGDTTIDAAWPAAGVTALRSDPSLTIVCGRLRERGRDDNRYGRLLDREWDGPVGELVACGGNAMIRRTALESLGGFDISLRGGEEADLCTRVRRHGGRVVRLDVFMGEHESGIRTRTQWWRRVRRVGYASAHACAAPATRQPAEVRRLLSATVWALCLPIAALTTIILAWTVPSHLRGLALAPVLLATLAYALLTWRIYRAERRRGSSRADAWLQARFCILAKWPRFVGQARYWIGRPD